ncbi:hypothetical protein [Rhodospirillum rubrum]|uniref:hypothetical protein n=1 Tax=Rhodospirillum rubrum TaxID=1085 RepID=UPI0019033C6C|nr:hypothetical protein [Rhodospirillum rubrum]
MGEKKLRMSKREKFLLIHDRCAYCGDKATTEDHCPPRVFFRRRVWPEDYVFPACERCNSEARYYEQALAVIFRMKNIDEIKDGWAHEFEEWKKIVVGVWNNQPDIINEWLSLGAVAKKRAFRKHFGKHGDLLRQCGWSALNIGPLTRSAISKFMIKIGKSIFYLHKKEIFSGVIYTFHVNFESIDDVEAMRCSRERINLDNPLIARNRKSLIDQFKYCFMEKQEGNLLFSVVEFSPQFTFIIAMHDLEADEMLTRDIPGLSDSNRVFERHICIVNKDHII